MYYIAGFCALLESLSDQIISCFIEAVEAKASSASSERRPSFVEHSACLYRIVQYSIV